MFPTLDTCKGGKRPSAHQKQILMKTFEAKPYLRKEEKYELSNVVNITKERIETWFKKRRQKVKKDGSKYIGK